MKGKKKHAPRVVLQWSISNIEKFAQCCSKGLNQLTNHLLPKRDAALM
jgi:hypothetical protein